MDRPAGRRGMVRVVGAAEKRLESLGRANQVRVARAELKRDVAAGKVAIAQVIAHPPSCARRAKVSDLLHAVPGIGPVRATRLLVRSQIPHAKTLDALSDRQRSALITSLANGSVSPS